MTYPVNILTCSLIDKDNCAINMVGPLDIETYWGIPVYMSSGGTDGTFQIKSIWFSAIDKKFFYYNKQIVLANPIKGILLGYFPYGYIVIWEFIDKKSSLICHGFAHDITDYICELKDEIKRLVCTHESSIISSNLYFNQFTYRYQLLFETWNEGKEVKWQKYKEDEIKPGFEYIEESLFDGTFDKLHDDGLLKYHSAGKPKKLAIKWHIKKSEYTAYFWFEDEKICSIFERFYGAHPDTKTDFIIRIDAEKKKYELALFRQGLKEPQIIPEDAYQLLVFKNKFEDYRSDNYNQERGAWIW